MTYLTFFTEHKNKTLGIFWSQSEMLEYNIMELNRTELMHSEFKTAF